MRRLILSCLIGAGLLVPAGADAAWNASGNGSSYTEAKEAPTGNVPGGSVSNRKVTVSWAESSFAGGGPVDGYRVKRYDTSSNLQAIGAACSGTITALSCVEQGVPPGDWRYAIVPRHGDDWSGAESSKSAAVTVLAPTFSFSSSTTVTSLPADLDGDIANFISGQTVTFRLDDPDTGTLLSGSITPDPVPGDGSAAVTLTIPNGTADGAHTVYAIGSAGDVASAAITVSVPVGSTFTTTAWTISDRSGATEDTSDAYAAAGGPYDFQGGIQSAFDTNRYLEFKYNAPLRAGFPTSGVDFNFDWVGYNAAFSATANACFYFEVRLISTGNVLATHGSAGAPVSCANQATFKQSSTALPEVDTTEIANDLQIRVFMNNADGSGWNFEDRATVTGSQGSNSFTLYETERTNRTSGVPTVIPWSLNANGDGAVYTSFNNWGAAFSGTKYVRATFPAYVPSDATDISATFKHSYKSDTPADNTCFYFEVYNGTTLLAAHGSAGTPVSCNSTTNFVTDTVALPEVDSVTKANNVVIRIYASNSGSRKTQHDLATVKVDYTIPPPTPEFTFSSPTTVTTLPTDLNGDIANYAAGQTVTFRLDDPSTGTLLSGSITPDPVPGDGSAAVTVTIPNGTAEGAHTVYAIGSGGDVVGAAITVNTTGPIARSLTTTAWSLTDLSGASVNSSDVFAFAGDGKYLTDNFGGFQPAFSTSRYHAFKYNAPVGSGLTPSGVDFKLDYVGTNAGLSAGTSCFYFDVRRISTGAVLATHGSAGTPVDCNTTVAFKSVTTALPEVSSAAIANDLEVRVYFNNSDPTGYLFIDRATVTGTANSTAFTLYDNSWVFASTGTPFPVAWSLATLDGSGYTSNKDWDTTFNAAKYLKLSFPSYLPSSATGVSATFKHTYKPATNGQTTCWYFAVYNGATLLATHGSSATPVSCNSTTSYVTDTVALPEVNSATKANNVVIRVYAKNTGSNNSRKSDHDLAELKIDYTG